MKGQSKPDIYKREGYNVEIYHIKKKKNKSVC